MSSPKVRAEPSDTHDISGDQQQSSENPVGMRIVAALGRRRVSWLARETGQPENTIRDAIRRGIAKTDLAIAIARALERSIDWLLTGAEIAGGDDEGAEVEQVDLAYGFGGTYSEGAVDVVRHRFSRAWLEQITSTPAAQLFFARGRGDSMEPTFYDGDMVLIDRSQRTVREQDAHWALTIGEIAMIKRLRVRGDRVQIMSDNDLVPGDEAQADDINIVGRVVFILRRK